MKRTRPQSTARIQQLRRVEAIFADAAYPVKLFEELTGLGPKGRREAQRRGLKVRLVGKTRHVLGEDWIEYLHQLPPDVLPT